MCEGSSKLFWAPLLSQSFPYSISRRFCVYLQVCGARNPVERAGHRPVSVRCVSAGLELSGRRLSAPLPAVRVFDRCCRPCRCALCVPGDARQWAVAHTGVWRVAAQWRSHCGEEGGAMVCSSNDLTYTTLYVIRCSLSLRCSTSCLSPSYACHQCQGWMYCWGGAGWWWWASAACAWASSLAWWQPSPHASPPEHRWSLHSSSSSIPTYPTWPQRCSTSLVSWRECSWVLPQRLLFYSPLQKYWNSKANWFVSALALFSEETVFVVLNKNIFVSHSY